MRGMWPQVGEHMFWFRFQNWCDGVVSKMGNYSSHMIIWVSCARHGLLPVCYSGITQKFLGFCFLFFFKLGTEVVPEVVMGLERMGEGSVDNTGIPRMHAPYCQVGFLHMHSMKGSHAAERNDGYVINMWQQVLSGAMDWCRVLSSGLSHPHLICKTVLIHRATLILFKRSVLSCLISKDLKQNAKKKKKWC